jgi:hypothetical protein
MVRLGAVAHYSAKGDRNAHVAMEDPLENRGYALWLTSQGKIRTSKPAKVTGPPDRGVGDVMGYEVEVNLKRKCFDLWPGLNQMDRASQDAFISEIYSYLRASGNAICVRKPGLGEHGIPLWWFRAEWNDVKAVGVYKTTELTARERRLTPQEAGEDREPAPVTVKQEAIAMTGRKGELMRVLRASPQPLYQSEISDALRLPSLTIGRFLRELLEEGRIYRRQESRGERPEDSPGRYRFLYWHEKKIPLRVAPLDVKNRTMERVNALKPGESLAIHWMSPGPKREVQELVDAGILEYFDVNKDGQAETRIRLAASAKTVETAQEPPKPAPPVESPAPARPAAVTGVVQPPATSALGEISAAIERIVEQRVSERRGHVDALMRQLEDEREQRRRLEATLVTRAGELSSITRERDELQEKLNGIRKSLGL